MNDRGMRRMTMGYGVSFSIGIVSLPLLGNALGGLSLLARGRDPLDALDGVGFACFAAMFGLAFLLRLILWQASPPAVRDGVRAFLTATFALLPIATLYTIARAVTQPRLPGWLQLFVVLAALCQIGTIAWALRYRRQL